MIYLDSEGKKKERLAKATGERLIVRLEKEIETKGVRENQESDYCRTFNDKLTKYGFDYYNQCVLQDWFRGRTQDIGYN